MTSKEASDLMLTQKFTFALAYPALLSHVDFNIMFLCRSL